VGGGVPPAVVNGQWDHHQLPDGNTDCLI